MLGIVEKMKKVFAPSLRSLQSKTEVDSEMEEVKPEVMQYWSARITVFSANLVILLDVL